MPLDPIIILQPRPLARTPAQLVLVPLLPLQPPGKHIPAELWNEILVHALFDGRNVELHPWRLSLLLVCKTFRVCLLSLNLYAFKADWWLLPASRS
jgi:hypothetical protein